MQLPRFGVNVTGQNVIQHDILDKVCLIKLFIVVLLDALQADGKHGSKLLCRGVRALHKDGVVIVLCVGELVIGIAIAHEGIPGCLTYSGNTLTHLTNLPQFGAGNDGAGLINHADNSIHCVLHLVDHVLEYPVSHTM